MRGVASVGILRRVQCRILSSPVLAVVASVALAACGDSPEPASDSDGAEPRTPRASALPASASARVAEPVAGESAASTELPVEQPGDEAAPAPTTSATGSPSSAKRDEPTSDTAVSEADVLKNGIALPPIEAPGAVRDIIEAGNSIARSPYLWGGGHGKWLDKGYDCSGSISFALASAGLLNAPLDSGRLMSWGKPGKGKWVTIYSNPGHVFMVVAGVRFDTSGTRVSGSRWQNSLRAGGGYVARHPAGL